MTTKQNSIEKCQKKKVEVVLSSLTQMFEKKI